MSLLVEATDAVMALLEAKKVALSIGGVFYGDQARLPHRWTVCVEPGSDMAELQGGFRRVKRVVTVYVLIYSNAIQSTEDNRRDSDVKAEEIEKELNSDSTLGGIFTHCYVTANESGYSIKDGKQVRSSRLTFEGTRNSHPLEQS
jgi:hypothetical protein